MAAIKIVIRNEKRQDGLCPLAIRVTKFRKTPYVYLNYTVSPKYWDARSQEVKRSHPNYWKLNDYLLARRKEAVDIALDLERDNPKVTAASIANKIKGKGTSFFEQAKIHLDNLKRSKNFNRWTNESSLIHHFREFFPGKDISLTEITPTLLKQFAAHLKQKGKGKEKNSEEVTETHIMNHMVVIRLIFNQAIDSKLVDEKYYPFGKRNFRIKFPETTKVGLNAAQVKTREYSSKCVSLKFS